MALHCYGLLSRCHCPKWALEWNTINGEASRSAKMTELSYPDSLLGNLGSEDQELDRLRQIDLGKVNGVDMTASLDVGCEANLMSEHNVQLTLTSFPTSKHISTFVNDYTRSTLGLV